MTLKKNKQSYQNNVEKIKKITKFDKYLTSTYGYHLYFLEKKLISANNLFFLKYFIDEYGKIKPKAETGLKECLQKKIAKLCKLSRIKKLLPYIISLNETLAS